MEEELNNNIETGGIVIPPTQPDMPNIPPIVVPQAPIEDNQTDSYDVIYTIENVVKIIESATGVKMKKVNNLDAEYIALGQITEEQLLDIGFVFSDFSSYIKCPIYKLGKNIEAIFNETILHIYDLRG